MAGLGPPCWVSLPSTPLVQESELRSEECLVGHTLARAYPVPAGMEAQSHQDMIWWWRGGVPVHNWGAVSRRRVCITRLQFHTLSEGSGAHPGQGAREGVPSGHEIFVRASDRWSALSPGCRVRGCVGSPGSWGFHLDFGWCSSPFYTKLGLGISPMTTGSVQ